ncbi:alpha/beta hydrolase [Promicromonospora sp. NPDC050262]|uniref:alpha/beta fold hydrolase n=1 Tax=Promicromonospora sp. NPDC050262 TaxID=3155036 RepID=UPI0033D968B9
MPGRASAPRPSALPEPVFVEVDVEVDGGGAGARERIATYVLEPDQAAFYRQIAQLSPEHTAPIVRRLGEVRCPVRIGWAEADPWIPFEQATRLRKRLPGNPEVVAFPGRGHLVLLEDDVAVGRAVRTWLAAADAG